MRSCRRRRRHRSRVQNSQSMFWYWFFLFFFFGFAVYAAYEGPPRALHLLIAAYRLLFKLFSMRLLCVNIVFSIYEPLPRCCPDSIHPDGCHRCQRDSPEFPHPNELNVWHTVCLSVCFIALARRQTSIGNLMNRNWKSSAYENLIKTVAHRAGIFG